MHKWNSDEQRAAEELDMYGRDCTNHVTEMYSPPRVPKMTRIMNLIPGMAFDLTQMDEEDGVPWDFNVPAKRNKARTVVQSERPLLLIGSPMCAAFSQLQRINFAKMNKERAEEILKHGRRHLEFCMELYRELLPLLQMPWSRGRA